MDRGKPPFIGDSWTTVNRSSLLLEAVTPHCFPNSRIPPSISIPPKVSLATRRLTRSRSVTAVETLLAAYRGHSGDQQESTKDKEPARLDHDQLLNILNIRRSSIRHAVDAVWPYSAEAHRPIRKTFCLPLTRPMGM
jgi:hypothetical protein